MYVRTLVVSIDKRNSPVLKINLYLLNSCYSVVYINLIAGFGVGRFAETQRKLYISLLPPDMAVSIIERA